MNNNFKKNFPGQNFGQRVAADNVAESATETVTTEVAEVATNKSGILTKKNIKIAGIVVGGALVVGGAVYAYKKFFGGKKKAAETPADPQDDFEEAK